MDDEHRLCKLQLLAMSAARDGDNPAPGHNQKGDAEHEERRRRNRAGNGDIEEEREPIAADSVNTAEDGTQDEHPREAVCHQIRGGRRSRNQCDDKNRTNRIKRAHRRDGYQRHQPIVNERGREAEGGCQTCIERGDFQFLVKEQNKGEVQHQNHAHDIEGDGTEVDAKHL